jgi:hypothetical protein
MPRADGESTQRSCLQLLRPGEASLPHSNTTAWHMACTHTPHEVKRRHGMEYVLILTLWSKGAELPMKLQSEGFFAQRRTCDNIARDLSYSLTQPERGFTVTAVCKRVG